MNRIEKTFKSLDRPALITFIMGGDPDADTTLEILKSLPEAGADIIEIGIPFTDPVADGPTIQEAGKRALKNGYNLHNAVEGVKTFRENGDEKTPIILMGYANSFLHYGFETFCADAAKAGVDGLIIVDLPPEEDAEFIKPMQENNLDLIRLITPTTNEERLQKIVKSASGFLYYVSITGVTGTAKPNPEDIAPQIETIRKATNLPIAIGFGIKTPEDVKAMAPLADGIVVGSAIVEEIEKNPKNAVKLVQSLARIL